MLGWKEEKSRIWPCEAYEGMTAARQGTGWCGKERSLLFQLEQRGRDVNVFTEQRDGAWLESCFRIARGAGSPGEVTLNVHDVCWWVI